MDGGALRLVGLADEMARPRARPGGLPRPPSERRRPIGDRRRRVPAASPRRNASHAPPAREADRAVAAAVDERGQGRRQVERAAQREPALDHRRIERRSGDEPGLGRLELRSAAEAPVSLGHGDLGARRRQGTRPGPGRSTTSGAYSRAPREAGGEVVGVRRPAAQRDCSASSAGSVDQGVNRHRARRRGSRSADPNAGRRAARRPRRSRPRAAAYATRRRRRPSAGTIDRRRSPPAAAPQASRFPSPSRRGPRTHPGRSRAPCSRCLLEGVAQPRDARRTGCQASSVSG